MGYLYVNAVNQQCEFKGKSAPTQLLVLTKFAELLDDKKKPVKRIGLERFEVITRLSRSTVQRTLKELEINGFLVCLDGKTIKGLKPKRYELRLPEGFNKTVVEDHIGKYYGGKKFSPTFYENNSNLTDAEKQLDPVTQTDESSEDSVNPPESQVNLTQNQVNLTQSQVNLTQSQVNLTQNQVKMTPNNNRTKKENNNNNKRGEGVGVVDNPEVALVVRQAVMVTNSEPAAFEDLGITPENAVIALRAVLYFLEEQKKKEEKGITIDNPVRYLHKIMKEALASNGANLVTSRSTTPLNICECNRFHLGQWMLFLLEGGKLSILGEERKGATFKAIAQRLFSPLPQLAELKRRWEAFLEAFDANNPVLPTDPDELAAAIEHAAEEAAQKFV